MQLDPVLLLPLRTHIGFHFGPVLDDIMEHCQGPPIPSIQCQVAVYLPQLAVPLPLVYRISVYSGCQGSGISYQVAEGNSCLLDGQGGIHEKFGKGEGPALSTLSHTNILAKFSSLKTTLIPTPSWKSKRSVQISVLKCRYIINICNDDNWECPQLKPPILIIWRCRQTFTGQWSCMLLLLEISLSFHNERRVFHLRNQLTSANFTSGVRVVFPYPYT